MSNESFFDYGDVVKLKRDLEDTNLKQGDCGIVWAVYASFAEENKGTLKFDYEGTFGQRRKIY